MKKPLTFVTGNENKLREFRAIMGDESITNTSLDLPEIQGSTQQVAIEKAKTAANLVKGPVLTEDTALGFNCMNGLPGPYIKWFLSSVGTDGLYKMVHSFDDKSAFALCTFAYCEGPGKDVILFEGRTDGTIVPPKGPNSFGWDPVFQPSGFTETYAEMPKELKNTISHRFKAVEKLKAFLNQN
ncbi:inosine triphosphate pyrophosphatase [Globomyces pollinis-pini]|nr:inosine triphosphate pyrophosphatase [Globomyces pollinis-pini]